MTNIRKKCMQIILLDYMMKNIKNILYKIILNLQRNKNLTKIISKIKSTVKVNFSNLNAHQSINSN